MAGNGPTEQSSDDQKHNKQGTR